MGEIVTLNLPPATPRLVPATTDIARDESALWTMTHLADAMSSIATAGQEIAEAQKMFLQQRTEPSTIVTAETVESIVRGLVAAIEVHGASNRDHALITAARAWLTERDGGGDVD